MCVCSVEVFDENRLFLDGKGCLRKGQMSPAQHEIYNGALVG